MFVLTISLYKCETSEGHHSWVSLPNMVVTNYPVKIYLTCVWILNVNHFLSCLVISDTLVVKLSEIDVKRIAKISLLCTRSNCPCMNKKCYYQVSCCPSIFLTGIVLIHVFRSSQSHRPKDASPCTQLPGYWRNKTYAWRNANRLPLPEGAVYKSCN